MDYYDELRGMLSETEIKYVGLGLAHAILFGDYDDSEDDSIDEESNPVSTSILDTSSSPAVNSSRLKEAARIIIGLDGKCEIRARLIQRLMREASDAAVARYLERERVPVAYHALVRLDDCIEILIRGIFYKVARLPRTASLDLDLVQLCDSLKKNDSKLIAYDRVGRLQQFVHEKLRLHGETGRLKKVRVEHMRCLLSVARLHLNLLDIECHDPGYAIYINEVSNARASLEYLCPEPPPPSTLGKQIYPRWRVRHLRPISYFYSIKTRRRLSALLGLDMELTFDAYVNAACRSFALDESPKAWSSR